MDARDLVRSVFAAIDAQDATALEQLIHPDAVLEMAMARGKEVRGRDAVMSVLRDAWQRVHELTIDELHALSPKAAIAGGHSRFPLEGGGFADDHVVWLCEYEDGMLVRQRLFRTVAEARSCWESDQAVSQSSS